MLLVWPGSSTPSFFHEKVMGPDPETTGLSRSGSQSHCVRFASPVIVTGTLTASAALRRAKPQAPVTSTSYDPALFVEIGLIVRLLLVAVPSSTPSLRQAYRNGPEP